MPKITFMGAGSTVFVRNVIGDSMLSPALQDGHIALYDIDGERLNDSKMMLDTLNNNINEGKTTITTHLGVENRKEALSGADYVVNAIQVGGYDSTVIDFDIPKKYGLRQTIADTLGIGGIFRALRTIPVVLDFARDMEEVCPDAWFLNYVNPMAMITGAMRHGTGVKTVGLCHSVQGCAWELLRRVGMADGREKIQWKIAGINHMGWLLEISDKGQDLYPEIKKRASELLESVRKQGAKNIVQKMENQYGELWHKRWWKDPEMPTEAGVVLDMVRLSMMLNFGHYITESSEHNAEYTPYWIKSSHPELIDEFNIPLDEYPRRCVAQIKKWNETRNTLVGNTELKHKRSVEYGSYIMEAMETDTPITIGGNVLNNGLIPNLPRKACVEIPCLVNRNGVQGCYVGELPEQCASLNRTNINAQLLTIQAALSLKKEAIYHAAMLDPHTSAELTIDQIRSLCDELIEAHGTILPEYK